MSGKPLDLTLDKPAGECCEGKMRTLVLLLAIGLATMSTSKLEAQNYASGDVNLRTGPGRSYDRIGTIPEGTRLDVIRCLRSGWCEVIVGWHRGWASGHYIRSVQRTFQQVIVLKSLEPIHNVRMHEDTVKFGAFSWIGDSALNEKPRQVVSIYPVHPRTYIYILP